MSVDIGLKGFLNSQLNLICRQATKKKWRYKVSDVSGEVWKKFGNALLVAASKTIGDFKYHNTKGDINGMWTLLCQVMCSAVETILIKTQSRNSELVKTAASSRFYKLELLVAKILNVYKSRNLEKFQDLVDKWVDLDFDQAVKFKSSLDNSYDSVLVEQSLVCFRKLYRSHKFLDSKATEDSQIQMAINKHIEAFVDNKGQIIRSVLERPFKKITLDHLVNNRNLVLEPDLVKRKQIDFDKFLLVVKNLSDSKAADLSGISNKMWKHCDESVLVLLLHLLNLCLILSDRILKACSIHNVLHENNFLVLKGTSTWSPIFVVRPVVEDALEKGKKLCLKDASLSMISVYTDSSVKDFGTFDAVRGMAAYFSDLGLHIGVEIHDLLLSILTEMQTVALALKCILASSNVTVFSDSQASLNAC
ncbi:hypothetical protein G9A89_020182 [Geosiphon pyriformis]|nr:hypothetical protein G9A89_020182 [Geosiphon pyriformis]